MDLTGQAETIRKRCSSCKSNRLLHTFKGNKKDYQTCCYCRKQPVPIQKKLVDNAIDLEDLSLYFHKKRRDYSTSREGYNIEIVIRFSQDMFNKTEDAIAQEIIELIKKVDGYQYYVSLSHGNKLRTMEKIHAYCSQSKRSRRFTDRSQLTRQRTRRRTFLCNGGIKIAVDKMAQFIQAHIYHAIVHPPASVDHYQLPEEVADFVWSLVEDNNDLDEKAIFYQVIEKFPQHHFIKKEHVHRCFQKIISEK